MIAIDYNPAAPWIDRRAAVVALRVVAAHGGYGPWDPDYANHAAWHLQCALARRGRYLAALTTRTP